MRITYGYGESDFENPGSDSALTSGFGTEFMSGIGCPAVSTFGSGAPSDFCTALLVVAGSRLASAGAGRAFLGTVVGRRAFPISWNSRQFKIDRGYNYEESG